MPAHYWKQINSYYFGSEWTCKVTYRCDYCGSIFQHYYKLIPRYFVAMNLYGTLGECDGYPQIYQSLLMDKYREMYKIWATSDDYEERERVKWVIKKIKDKIYPDD